MHRINQYLHVGTVDQNFLSSSCNAPATRQFTFTNLSSIINHHHLYHLYHHHHHHHPTTPITPTTQQSNLLTPKKPPPFPPSPSH